jgi:hypothetical protein
VTSVPSVVASVFSSRSAATPLEAKRTSLTLSAASLAASRSATFSSTGTSMGSTSTGVRQVPLAGVTGASVTGRRCARRAARAVATASAAARRTPALLTSCVAEKPQAPSTSARTPTPKLSVSLTLVTWRSRVAMACRR